MIWKTFTLSAAAVAVAIFFAQGNTSVAVAQGAEQDIVETAVASGKFKTLVTAVQAAGLVDTLKGNGPFTVFAPTDEAFAKLPKGTVEALLKDKKGLAAVLTYHVVSGKVMADDVVKLNSARTVQGQSITIVTKDGRVTLNGVNVIMTDIVCKNGVIHVIDAVLLPPEKKVGAAEARQMIEQAVIHGARSYNAGHHIACADIYMKTMRELIANGNFMPEEIVTSMKHVFNQADSTHCPTQRAWILRRGIDHAYARMAQLP